MAEVDYEFALKLAAGKRKLMRKSSVVDLSIKVLCSLGPVIYHSLSFSGVYHCIILCKINFYLTASNILMKLGILNKNVLSSS